MRLGFLLPLFVPMACAGARGSTETPGQQAAIEAVIREERLGSTDPRYCWIAAPAGTWEDSLTVMLPLVLEEESVWLHVRAAGVPPDAIESFVRRNSDGGYHEQLMRDVAIVAGRTGMTYVRSRDASQIAVVCDEGGVICSFFSVGFAGLRDALVYVEYSGGGDSNGFFYYLVWDDRSREYVLDSEIVAYL